mgnify:CR=1 FL=1
MVLTSNEKRAFFRQQCREALAAHICMLWSSLRRVSEMSETNPRQMTDLALSSLPARSVYSRRPGMDTLGR